MLTALKLTSGDTVVGILSFEDEFVFTIGDPFIMEMRVDSNGYRALVMYRYNQFSQEPAMDFSKTQVVSVYTPDSDLEDYYYLSLEHTLKFRDKTMSSDIQKACQHLQLLIDNNNEIPIKKTNRFGKEEDKIVPLNPNKPSGNTFH